MNKFEKTTQPNKEKDISNLETLIVKDRTAIEVRHKEVVDKMLRQEIPAEPNIGNIEGLYDDNTIFLGLSGLKEHYGDNWAPIAENLSQYLNQEGGKRLRPLLLLNGYKMFSCGAEPSEEVINAGIGLEILHETALLLDDVMDNSRLRRGALSLWAKIENIPTISPMDAKKVTADLGHLPFSWTRYLMVDEVDDKIKSEVNKIFWQAILDMKYGQNDDNISAHASEWPSLERVFEQFYLKTSSYSMRLPLLFALHASGTKIDNNILNGIEVFSRGFGLAFQLHDDLLITKTSSEIGKDSTIDAFNGTKIPVVILARQLGNQEEINFIDKVWGNPPLLTPENILELKKIFETTRALQKIVKMMKLEVEKAKAGLDIIAQAGFDVSSLRHLLNTGLPWMDDLNTSIENQK